MKISASFLESNNIIEDIYKLDKTDVDYLHVDIMDGNWVKRKTFKYKEIKHYTSNISKRLDIHLMVKKPLKYVKKYIDLNVAFITIHLEDTIDLNKTINYIKAHNIKVGLSIKPETNFESLYPYLEKIDLVLLMGVNPGYGGQKIVDNINERLTKLKNYLNTKKLNTLISVDGGINNDNKHLVSKADILVIGSYILNSNNYQEQINKMRGN
ncbi:MAG: ribulose-phosphate 3-epimerase [Tenericutes bacterium]|nr:ribulose-phosphate 3-epimerase [Mycoplasmatota bacterium]